MRELPLSELQRRFQRLVTAPEGVARALVERPDDGALVALVAGDAVARIDIYARMYFYRLRDILAGEFPTLVGIVGADAFHDLVTDYLLALPPNHPSVRNAGQRLPAFVATHALGRERPWLADLARLERARLEVFDAADSVPLELAFLRTLAPAQFAQLALRFVSALAVIRISTGAAEAWQQAARGPAPEPAPPLDEQDHIVWRGRDPMVVHHRALTPVESALVERLAEGTTFGAICERLSHDHSDEDAARLAAEHLARWVREGIVTNLPAQGTGNVQVPGSA